MRAHSGGHPTPHPTPSHSPPFSRPTHVRHVDRILKHAPVVALELDLPVHGLPAGVLQLRHGRDGRPLGVGEVRAPVEQPAEAAALDDGVGVDQALVRPLARMLGGGDGA